MITTMIMSKNFVFVLSLIFVSVSANFPHFVRFDVEANGRYITRGGSLISNTKIVTGASCFDDSGFNISPITLGASNKANETIVYRDAEEVFIHEGYIKNSGLNDIAVLILDEPVEQSLYIKSIQLTNYYPNNVNVMISGMAEDEEYLEFSLWSTAQCAPYILQQTTILVNQLCIYNPSISTKLWTRGGAVFLRTSDGTDVQIGLISSITDKYLQELPIVVTSIGPYLPWIQSKGF